MEGSTSSTRSSWWLIKRERLCSSAPTSQSWFNIRWSGKSLRTATTLVKMKMMMSPIIMRMAKTKSTWRTSRKRERRWSINRIGITKLGWILIIRTTIGPDNRELGSKISTFIRNLTLSRFILLPSRLSRSLRKCWKTSWHRKEGTNTKWWIFGASKNCWVGRSLQILGLQTSRTFPAAD